MPDRNYSLIGTYEYSLTPTHPSSTLDGYSSLLEMLSSDIPINDLIIQGY